MGEAFRRILTRYHNLPNLPAVTPSLHILIPIHRHWTCQECGYALDWWHNSPLSVIFPISEAHSDPWPRAREKNDQWKHPSLTFYTKQGNIISFPAFTTQNIRTFIYHSHPSLKLVISFPDSNKVLISTFSTLRGISKALAVLYIP